MSDALDPAVLRLLASAEALAAVGAWQRARVEGIALDPRIDAALQAVVHATGVPVEAAGPEALGAIRALFAQAADLLEHPDRAPGWSHLSPALLQGQGRASGMIPGLFATAPALEVHLARPGARFLDVGAGAGWLAIAAAERWPALQVVGIDVWEPALELARANVAARGLTDRVALALDDVCGHRPAEAYDVAWLPMPFLSPDVRPAALRATRAALHPGGTVVFGVYAGAGDPLTEALAHLRSVRSGGAGLPDDALGKLAAQAGFIDFDEIPRTWRAPMRVLTARRP